MFLGLGKRVSKTWCKFTEVHPCHEITHEITLQHGCSPVNLLHISGGLLLMLFNLLLSLSNRLILHSFTLVYQKLSQNYSKLQNARLIVNTSGDIFHNSTCIVMPYNTRNHIKYLFLKSLVTIRMNEIFPCLACYGQKLNFLVRKSRQGKRKVEKGNKINARSRKEMEKMKLK